MGLVGLAWEWPLGLLAGTGLHRSMEARFIIYPLSALVALLIYQGTNAGLYYIIGMAAYFWAYSEGEVSHFIGQCAIIMTHRTRSSAPSHGLCPSVAPQRAGPVYNQLHFNSLDQFRTQDEGFLNDDSSLSEHFHLISLYQPLTDAAAALLEAPTKEPRRRVRHFSLSSPSRASANLACIIKTLPYAV